MVTPDVLSNLVDWIHGSAEGAGNPSRLHCLRVAKSVEAPDGTRLSAVSVRHQLPLATRVPESFVVELWDLKPGALGEEDVSRACRHLAGYRAWYAELLEGAEWTGRRRRHRFSVHANLVGTSVLSSPFIELLSGSGAELALWTYHTVEGKTRFEPYVGEGTEGVVSPLARMLDHLPWQEPSDLLLMTSEGPSEA